MLTNNWCPSFNTYYFDSSCLYINFLLSSSKILSKIKSNILHFKKDLKFDFYRTPLFSTDSQVTTINGPHRAYYSPMSTILLSILRHKPKTLNQLKQIHALLILTGLKSSSTLAKLIEHHFHLFRRQIPSYAHLILNHETHNQLFLLNTLIKCSSPETPFFFLPNIFQVHPLFLMIIPSFLLLVLVLDLLLYQLYMKENKFMLVQ